LFVRPSIEVLKIVPLNSRSQKLFRTLSSYVHFRAATARNGRRRCCNLQAPSAFFLYLQLSNHLAISKLPLLSFCICSFPITSQIWWPLLRGVTTGDNWQSSRQKNLGGGSQTTTRKNKKLVEHTFPLGVNCMIAFINLWELRPTAWIPCPVAKLSTSLNERWFSCSIYCRYSCIRSTSATCS